MVSSEEDRMRDPVANSKQMPVNLAGAEVRAVLSGCMKSLRRASPLFTVGDLLWVREAFAVVEIDDVQGERVFYRADYPNGEHQTRPGYFLRWTRAASMDRELSRIEIEITASRIEGDEWVADFEVRKRPRRS